MTDLPDVKPMKATKTPGKAAAGLKKVAGGIKNDAPGMSAHASRGNKVAAKAPPIC